MYDFSVKLGEIFESLIKIEIICRDDSVEELTEVIRRAASTGRKGDGMIFVASTTRSGSARENAGGSLGQVRMRSLEVTVFPASAIVEAAAHLLAGARHPERSNRAGAPMWLSCCRQRRDHGGYWIFSTTTLTVVPGVRVRART